MASLKELETKTYKNEAEVVFQDVDFNLLTLEEQIKVDLQTDILIGPHGAGLMHTIFMRDRATLMELQVDGSGVNRHFHNLAAWAGKKYLGVGTGNPVDVRGLNNLVIRVIEELNLDSY